MTVAITRTAPACATVTDVFCHPLLEDPLPSAAPAAQRQARAVLAARATETCASCPLFTSCLYEAVVAHDVYGFVAGTTARQRLEIRAELGISVEPEDFDTIAGVTGPNRQVDHDEVVRLRSTNPHDSLDSIANRLGCSLSTVKRHLRRERDADSCDLAPAPAGPSAREVLDAFASVVRGARRRAA